MTLYGVLLFVHMLGLIALFGGLVIAQNGGARMRRATGWPEVRTWLDLLQLVPRMLAGGSVLTLLSGIELARERWGFRQPWIVVGVVVAVVLIPIGAIVVARQLAALRRAGEGEQGASSEAGRALMHAPALWSWLFGINGGAMAVVWLMATKPGWTGAIVISVLAAAAGFLAGWLTVRRRGASVRAAAPGRTPDAIPRGAGPR